MSTRSRIIPNVTCLECNKTLPSTHFGRHIKSDHGYNNTREYEVKHGLAKSNKDLLNEGAVICKICGMVSHDIIAHLTRTHKVKIPEYTMKYNSPVRSDSYLKYQSERIKGDKNPGYQHGGKFSPFSDKFVGKTETSKKDATEKAHQSRLDNNSYVTKTSYWISRGYTEDEAKELISERQVTFSLEICIKKHGEEKGRRVWVERQKKWHDNYEKSNFSKVSQTLFWDVYSKMSEEDQKDTFFAQLGKNKKKDDSGKNNEKSLIVNNKVISPDFLIESKKMVIEFDGDYWHSKRQNKDAYRDRILRESGYTVLHIPEKDFKKDAEKVVQSCLDFINANQQ